jgi:hypothetical protein
MSFLSASPGSGDRRLWESISERLVSPLPLDQVDFPLKEAKSLKRRISYLTRKRGGNLTIASKSVYSLEFWNAEISSQGTSQVSGFAEISTDCASARLITQSRIRAIRELRLSHWKFLDDERRVVLGLDQTMKP